MLQRVSSLHFHMTEFALLRDAKRISTDHVGDF